MVLAVVFVACVAVISVVSRIISATFVAILGLVVAVCLVSVVGIDIAVECRVVAVSSVPNLPLHAHQVSANNQSLHCSHSVHPRPHFPLHLTTLSF